MTSKRVLKLLFVGFFAWALLSLVGFKVKAKMQPLNQTELSDVTAQQAGLSFALENLKVSGHQTFALREVETSSQLGDDNSNVGSLILSNLSVSNPDGSNGVQWGTVDNPITIDVDGSQDGYLIAELPGQSAMDATNIEFGGAWVKDNGFASGDPRKFASNFGLQNVQLAGSYFGVGFKDGGGLRLSMGLQLNGDVVIESPEGPGLKVTGIHANGQCENSNGNPCTASNFVNNPDNLTFSGPLSLANIEDDRPLLVNSFTENGISKLKIEYNPDDIVFPSRQGDVLAVEEVSLNGVSLGEVWTGGLKINHLEITGPEPRLETFEGANNIQESYNDLSEYQGSGPPG